mgnify:CR=1 FL=1
MHERSITVEIDGSYYNIPSVVNGRQLNDADATMHATRSKTLGEAFPSLDMAVGAAKKRSATFDHPLGGSRPLGRSRVPIGRR